MNRSREMQKPVLLIFPFEQLAHYLRCLTLAKHLEPYFQIYVAYSQPYATFVQQEGFETFDCPGMDATQVLECVKRFDFSWINTQNLQTSLTNQIAAIERLQPAVVLGDTVPTLCMAAEKTGVPYVSLMNGYMSKYYAGVRKMSWRYPLYPYFKFLPAPLLDYFTQKGEQASFFTIHNPFRQLRQQYGLLKKWRYADELEGDLNLLCDLPALFPQRNLPGHYQIIPPLIYQAPTKTLLPEGKWNPNKQTLFVSMGSTGDWQQAAFLNDPHFQKYNIITAGDKTGVIQGTHVIPVRFANAQQLFPQVDLVLCHGGNGTIYQALQYGIPILCKTAHFEQEWNVQALQQKQLGASLDAVHSLAQLAKIIDTWMGRKGSKPLWQIQQLLAHSTNMQPVIERIRSLLPAPAKTVYRHPQKKSA